MLPFDPSLGERPRVPRGEVVLGCRSARSWGSALGFRVVAAPSLHISLLGPGGEPAVAVCGVNCRRWQPRGLHEGTVPSRGLTVRLTITDSEKHQQAAAATTSTSDSTSTSTTVPGVLCCKQKHGLWIEISSILFEHNHNNKHSNTEQPRQGQQPQ